MSNKENAHNSNNMDIDNEDEWEEEVSLFKIVFKIIIKQ